jgi:hypothetical protein
MTAISIHSYPHYHHITPIHAKALNGLTNALIHRIKGPQTRIKPEIKGIATKVDSKELPGLLATAF